MSEIPDTLGPPVAKEHFADLVFVERAKESDLNEICRMALKLEIELKTISDSSRKLPTTSMLEARYRERILNDKTCVLLAKDGDNVTGFLYGWVDPSIKQSGWVHGIYVEPEYRKRGHSRRLLAEFEDFTRTNNLNQIGCQTYIDSPSHSMFLENGWKEFMKVGNDEVKLIKNISQ